MLLPTQERGSAGARVWTSVRVRVSDVRYVGTEDSDVYKPQIWRTPRYHRIQSWGPLWEESI